MTWWESWFGEEYLDLYPHRDAASARREAAFALAHLPSQPNPLLDLCCGSGRHSIPLAEAGSPSVGLDYSAPLLDLARQRDRHLALVRGDMRALPFRDGAFRTVVNFFTSFGYFLTEAENTSVVAEIERVLQGGGSFLCDTFCRDHVLARLVADQPLVDPQISTQPWPEERYRYHEDVGIRAPVRNRQGRVLVDAHVFRGSVGPCFDFLTGYDEVLAPEHSPLAVYMAGPKNDAEERAKTALAAALLRRAREVRAGRAVPGVDPWRILRDARTAQEAHDPAPEAVSH